ncbi:hypothetical protein [Antricoccus suffuscus]|nr:hypothetical protein [Antricoccus suffuscus]
MTDQYRTDGKARFDDIYDMPDPRAYFDALGPLNYDIPQQAMPIFTRLLERHRARFSAGAGVLDLCCSYGINAALMRSDLTLNDLTSHYTDPSVANLSPEEMARADREFFAQHRRPNGPRTIGLDAARNAVSYACQAGLLDSGLAEDLENNEPSSQFAETIEGVELITTTGGVGYITDRTFGRILQALPEDSTPWVAAFVLRMYSYDEIAIRLAEHGLVTEQLPGVTFHQREFASDEERDSTLRAVRARGLDTADIEEKGSYYATLFLSRPAADVDAEPIEKLLGDITTAR